MCLPLQAAAQARQLLGLSHVQALVLHELLSGQATLLPAAIPFTVQGLCALHQQQSAKPTWQAFCNLMNKALQVNWN